MCGQQHQATDCADTPPDSQLVAHPGFIGKSSHLDSLQDRGKVTDQRDVHHTNIIGSDYDLHRIVNMFLHCLRLRQEEKRKKMTNNSQFLLSY